MSTLEFDDAVAQAVYRSPNLSAKTRAEMSAGQKQVQAAQAWDRADQMEKKLRAKYPSNHVRIWAEFRERDAERLTSTWVLTTRVYPKGIQKDYVDLDIEDIASFPSDKLITQLMLLLG